MRSAVICSVAMLGVTSPVGAVPVDHVPTCSYEDKPGILSLIATGAATGQVEESASGDCFMVNQHQALKDKIVLDGCPGRVRLITANDEAYYLLIKAPIARPDSVYGKSYAEDRAVVAERVTTYGCENIQTYFDFSTGRTEFLELVN